MGFKLHVKAVHRDGPTGRRPTSGNNNINNVLGNENACYSGSIVAANNLPIADAQMHHTVASSKHTTHTHHLLYGNRNHGSFVVVPSKIHTLTITFFLRFRALRSPAIQAHFIVTRDFSAAMLYRLRSRESRKKNDEQKSNNQRAAFITIILAV